MGKKMTSRQLQKLAFRCAELFYEDSLEGEERCLMLSELALAAGQATKEEVDEVKTRVETDRRTLEQVRT